ncbi:MAG: hypothetical protein WC565_00095 [Parcubacteria group bacterium]
MEMVLGLKTVCECGAIGETSLEDFRRMFPRAHLIPITRFFKLDGALLKTEQCPKCAEITLKDSLEGAKMIPIKRVLKKPKTGLAQ